MAKALTVLGAALTRGLIISGGVHQPAAPAQRDAHASIGAEELDHLRKVERAARWFVVAALDSEKPPEVGPQVAADLLEAFGTVPPRPETWAEVEVVGHRSYVGRVREDVIAGVRLVRVEALRADGTFEAFSYGHQAIFSITPRSEAEVRRAAVPKSYQPRDAFAPSGACPGACIHCGHDPCVAARAETKANDASMLGTAEGRAERTAGDDGKGDDMPW